MQIECSKHLRLLSFFCCHPFCQSYLCKECCNDHLNHQILGTKEFADYALQEVKRRQQKLEQNTQQFDKKLTVNYIAKVKDGIVKLGDTMKGIADTVFKKFEGVLTNILIHTKEEIKATNRAEITLEKNNLQELRNGLLTAKENEHFLAVQNVWEKLKIHNNIVIPVNNHNNFAELFITLEEIKKYSDKLIKNLGEIKEDTHRSLAEFRHSSFSSDILFLPEKCNTCKIHNYVYLIQECSHGICLECAKNVICEKTSSKGLKVIDIGFECKTCGYEGPAFQLTHEQCSCTINTKKFKEEFKTPYLWDKDVGKFQWPVCKQGKALTQEDIFFIYGGSAFTFPYECLSFKRLSETVKENEEYKYMILPRELHREDVEDVKKILQNTEIEHLIWRGQRPQVLMTALELPKMVKAVNFGMNSLGDSGIQNICQLHGFFDNLELLDLCTIEY